MKLSYALILSVLSALSGMGVGSGGLPVLWLTWGLGFSQQTAQGLNLLSFLCSAGASVLLQWRKKLSFPRIYLLLLSGIPGALLGSYLASIVSADICRRLFGGFLFFSGLITLWSSRKKQKCCKNPSA